MDVIRSFYCISFLPFSLSDVIKGFIFPRKLLIKSCFRNGEFQGKFFHFIKSCFPFKLKKFPEERLDHRESCRNYKFASQKISSSKSDIIEYKFCTGLFFQYLVIDPTLKSVK